MAGTIANDCHIRIGGLGFSDAIGYSDGRFSFHTEKSFNEIVSIDDGEEGLRFKFLFGSETIHYKKEHFTPSEAASAHGSVASRRRQQAGHGEEESRNTACRQAAIHEKLVASMEQARHTGKWQPLWTALIAVPPGPNRILINTWIERFSPFWAPIHLPDICLRFVRNPERTFEVIAAITRPFWTMDSQETPFESNPRRKRWIRFVLIPPGFLSI